MGGHAYAERLRRAAQATADAGVGALVITPSADLVYLGGYDPPPLERLTALLVRPNADPLLIVPILERPRAAASSLGELVQMQTWPDGGDPYRLIARALDTSAIYAVSDRMPAVHLLGIQDALPGAGFVAASSITRRLRIRKDQAEIEALARAARSDDAAFSRIIAEPLKGRTESDVASSLRRHIVDAGQDEPLFWIVGSGPNGASPHHDPGDRTIRRGDAVVLDFGGRAGGYCSDMTRTVAVGHATQEVREIHAVVREAQDAALRAVRPGIAAQEVDRAARRIIGDAGYGDAFFHRTGHGIGLEEHEDPYIVEGNAEPLEPGMCFSIEPGIYLKGRLGVRIEDIVMVTEDGARPLNEAPRDLAIVD